MYNYASQSVEMVYLARRACRRWSDSCFFAYLIAKLSTTRVKIVARFVSPEAWSVLDRIIAKLVKVFGEFHIGDDPHSFYSVHYFYDLEVYPSVFID